MLFSSVIFLFYFLPIVLILYYGTCFSKKIQNAVLLISSLFFYAWGETKFIILMIGSIFINYLFGLIIDKYRENKEKAKIIIISMCITNLSILFVFKYLGFVIRNINEMQSYQFIIPKLSLPIGISFFTFKAISYVIDVYRNNCVVQNNPFYVGLYIAFFPQVLSGPISRYNIIGEQIKNRKETWQKFSVGCCRFIIGLAKKVLIAGSMAVISDRIFQMNSNIAIPISLAWLGSIAYTFQIFFDFAGYSDMAIGLGLMFGFKIDENFNYPYISKSIGEFWRRWHISLSSWFKDYVYFPLGGSRVANKDKVIRNLLVVWLLTGIWHGAEWTFIIWGLLNFVFIALEKVFSFDELKINNSIRHIYALFIINLGWVLFRSKDLIEAGNYIACMFGAKNNGFWSDYTFMFIKENLIFFIAAILFSTPIAKKANKYIFDRAVGYKIIEGIYPLVIISLFFVCISYIIKGSYNPFIYFNF
ncbi:peptidoglycan O-acetyltransferase [Clostridium puniceum]|uniref:Peptidoglycan O-acetyltransferase n=2 Tax=Clostridium puniceum TaxID=29367 RepID=A0A1S8THD9_9CLOT|nr:MBOAT family protein [Clostridium puniceum]OOM77168.1 peptidoglycan O-acetyltransferase [Clostridium puniceum]